MLSILLTAPLGSLLIAVLGPLLLQRDKDYNRKNSSVTKLQESDGYAEEGNQTEERVGDQIDEEERANLRDSSI